MERRINMPFRPATKFVQDEFKLNRRLNHLTGYAGCQIIQYHDTGELTMRIVFDSETVHTDAENEFLSKIAKSKINISRNREVYTLDVDKALVELKMRRPKKDL